MDFCQRERLMSHDGSEDPVDYTISNAIYDLIEGKAANFVAEELGWGIEDLDDIHPTTIDDQKLATLADEHYWPYEHLRELKLAIKNYRLQN